MYLQVYIILKNRKGEKNDKKNIKKSSYLFNLF